MQDPNVFLQNVAREFFSPLYELAVGVTVVYFLYGVARYVYDLTQAKPDNQEEGRAHLLYGMIGLFIVLSVGGLLTWIKDIFDGFFQ